MKWFAAASRLLVGLGLAAVAAAAPQLTGSAIGHWGQVNANTAVVLGEAPSDQSDTVYDLRMHVLGDGSGRVRGELRQREQGEGGESIIDLVYQLDGVHMTLPDGRIGVRAKILLDLSQFGAEGVVEVGRMEGLMFQAPGTLGYCPVLPPRGIATESGLVRHKAGSGIGVIDPTGAPDPLPGEFIARWILD